MIALGTSHTAGDCDGPSNGPNTIKITAYDMIANPSSLAIISCAVIFIEVGPYVGPSQSPHVLLVPSAIIKGSSGKV